MKALKVMKGSKKDLTEADGRSPKEIEEARESFTGFDPEDPPISFGHDPTSVGVQSDHRRLFLLKFSFDLVRLSIAHCSSAYLNLTQCSSARIEAT